MNTVIIQARLTSTRLPKKILRKLGNISVLDHVLMRVKRSKYFKNIVVAVPNGQENEIKNNIVSKQVDFFSGSENDVLNRFYKCAKKNKSKVICRITSDCPLIDWRIIDASYERFKDLGGKCYVANTCPPPSKFPDGMDVEIFPFSMLDTANKKETDKSFREHVTFQFWKKSEYASYLINSKEDYSDLRLTLDYELDFNNLSKFINEFCPNGEDLSMDEIISIIKKNNTLDFFRNSELRNKGWYK